MEDAKTKRDPVDALLARSNVKKTLSQVQKAKNTMAFSPDEPFWLTAPQGERPAQAAQSSEDKKTQEKYEAERQEAKTAGLDKKCEAPDREKSHRTVDDKKKNGTAEKRRQPAGLQPVPCHWDDFLARLEERRRNRYKGKTSVIHMPSGIIDALQTAFGRRSADILTILALEFFEREKDNIQAHIRKRSNPNMND